MSIERTENLKRTRKVNQTVTQLKFTFAELKAIINGAYPGPPTMVRPNEDVTKVTATDSHVFVDLE